MTDASRLPPPASREGQTFHGASRLTAYINFVKLPHTLFALPFALVGTVLASYERSVTTGQVGWVVLAFSAARFAAMGFNRIADRHIDARNPRTARRELPSGVLSLTEAMTSVGIASAVFLLAAWRLNTLCLALSPVALVWIFAYSYTKRFTRWSHLVLGLGLSIAPVGGYLAITGRWSEPWWMLCALAIAVATLQDVQFDRENALHSVPAALGEAGALATARLLHVVAVVTLAAVGIAVGGGWLYVAGVVVAGALLSYEHSLVRVGDLSRLDAAFFTMNGIISIAFFAFVLAERLMQ
jgi:4-hydroxybenzoate polyprenyltransferase